MPTLQFVALLLLSVATLLPLLHVRRWWVRSLDFPRLQIAVLLSFWLLLALAQHLFDLGRPLPWPAILLGLAMLLAQLWWIWPTTPWHRREVPDATPDDEGKATLSLLVSNVLMDNRNSDALLAHVRQQSPDMLVTLESDAWWQSRLDTLDAYPHRVAIPLDNLYGMHLYSRLPLLETSVDYLVEDDIPSIAACVGLPDGSSLMLHVVHPRPPAPGENTRSTERDVELVVLARAIQHSEERIVVTGDLNDVAWSETTRLFRRISGLLDPRTGRGMINTFHAGHWFLRWPLDHVFVSPHFRVVRLQRLASIGSDHFPVLAEFTIDTAEAGGTPPTPPSEDDPLLRSTLEEPVARSADTPGITR